MIQIDPERCVGCGQCVDDCFPQALELTDGKAALVHPDWCIRCGHCIALCPLGLPTDPEQDMTEVRENKGRGALPEGALEALMQNRRATRHFKDRPIPEQVLQRVLDAGRWSPTAKNRQGTSYLAVTDKIPELKDLAIHQLSRLGQVSLLRGAEPDMVRRLQKFIAWEKQLKTDPDFDPLFFHAPMLLLVLSDREGRLDAAGAAAYMELAAADQGLGTLYSGYFAAAAQDNPAITGLLGLEPGEELVRCLVLGWPDIHFLRNPPRDKARVRYL